MITKIKNVIDIMLKVVYPQKCIFCKEVINFNEDNFMCKNCDTEINYITTDKEPSISVFEYNEITKYSIYRLKYFNKPYYSKYFAKLMYLKLSKLNYKNYDLIVNVPMHLKKKKKRGYDQAELLAIELSKLSNIKTEKNCLIRIKNTIAQSKISLEERKENVEGIFKVKDKDIVKNKNILLIDDIYTTGNTIYQCAKELKNAGANNICIFTLAKSFIKT